MKHVYLAEKLAASADEQALATLRSSGDLGGVRSEAGCDMLFVYLLKRWGSIFEPGMPGLIERSEALQEQVVDAYVAAGCAVDAPVPTRHLYTHTGPNFRNMVRLSGKLSALGFVQLLLGQLHPDMFPAAYPSLERLAARLASHADGTFQLQAQRVPDTACGLLARGVRVLVSGAELDLLREGAEQLGLTVLVAGDPPEQAPIDAVIGQELLRASVEDGGPVPVSGFAKAGFTALQARFLQPLGQTDTYLLASGPLASCSLVRGALGTRKEAQDGRFIAGTDMAQNPHPAGVWGEVLFSADSTPRACTLDDAEDLFLVPRYD